LIGRARRGALACLVLALAPLSAQENQDALLEYRAGDFASAVALCRSEIAATPNKLDAYAVLGWSLLKLEDWDGAAAAAAAGRAVNRYDPRLIEIMAEARFHQGGNDESLRLFQEYVAVAPEGGRIDAVYYYLGEIFIRLGKYRHADIALTSAVRYQPGSAVWWTRLGYARERSGESRYGLAAYQTALGLDPQSIDAQRGIERCGGAPAR
jgi:tetratricopeptide (TPR) repeat protein